MRLSFVFLLALAAQAFANPFIAQQQREAMFHVTSAIQLIRANLKTGTSSSHLKQSFSLASFNSGFQLKNDSTCTDSIQAYINLAQNTTGPCAVSPVAESFDFNTQSVDYCSGSCPALLVSASNDIRTACADRTSNDVIVDYIPALQFLFNVNDATASLCAKDTTTNKYCLAEYLQDLPTNASALTSTQLNTLCSSCMQTALRGFINSEAFPGDNELALICSKDTSGSYCIELVDSLNASVINSDTAPSPAEAAQLAEAFCSPCFGRFLSYASNVISGSDNSTYLASLQEGFCVRDNGVTCLQRLASINPDSLNPDSISQSCLQEIGNANGNICAISQGCINSFKGLISSVFGCCIGSLFAFIPVDGLPLCIIPDACPTDAYIITTTVNATNLNATYYDTYSNSINSGIMSDLAVSTGGARIDLYGRPAQVPILNGGSGFKLASQDVGVSFDVTIRAQDRATADAIVAGFAQVKFRSLSTEYRGVVDPLQPVTAAAVGKVEVRSSSAMSMSILVSALVGMIALLM